MIPQRLLSLSVSAFCLLLSEVGAKTVNTYDNPDEIVALSPEGSAEAPSESEVSPEELESVIAEDFKASVEDLIGKTRKRSLGEIDGKEAKRLLKDERVSERLRFKASARLKEAQLSRENLSSRTGKRERRVRDARELIEEFPAQGEAYGYLLSLAKSYEGAKALELAEELVSEAVPERIRKHALRIAARQKLGAGDIALSALDLDGGVPSRLVVYGWTLERPPHWLISSGQLEERGVVLVGVCLDKNEELARSSASALGLGSTVVYGPDGLDSEIAEALELTMERFVYILGPEGLDVDGHRNFGRKAASLMGFDLDLVAGAQEGGER